MTMEKFCCFSCRLKTKSLYVIQANIYNTFFKTFTYKSDQSFQLHSDMKIYIGKYKFKPIYSAIIGTLYQYKSSLKIKDTLILQTNLPGTKCNDNFSVH